MQAVALINNLYTYRATVRSIYDGDTIRVDVDLGFGQHSKGDTGRGIAVRLLGLNAPELGTKEAVASRNYLMQLLPIGSECILRSVKNDKYGGRYDALIWHPVSGDITAAMIKSGHAVAWDGTGSAPTTPTI